MSQRNASNNLGQNLDFDLAKFQTYLLEKFPTGHSLNIERVAGGQSNPTYFVRWGARDMVLRKKPNGDILRGAHAIEREHKVLEALAPTSVPAPKPIILENDQTIIGTPFYLMERVEGRVFTNCALPGLQALERNKIYLAIADTLAGLHQVDPAKIGLKDFGRSGNYFERQINRWGRQWHDSNSAPIPDLDKVEHWLRNNTPADDAASSIAHGDFRLGNLMFHPTQPRVVAILDWELSTIGHPLADLGFCCMPWNTAPSEYGGIQGLDLSALGIPTKKEFVARYINQIPTSGPLLPFHQVFALFRFAVIFVGIADRARQGNASAENAANLGPLAARFAARAMALTE